MTTATTAPAQQQAEQRAAANRHLLTLTFPGGQVALLDIRGASDPEAARAVAHAAFKGCRYEIVDGDQTGGDAAIFYQWCSIAAQVAQPRRREVVQ